MHIELDIVDNQWPHIRLVVNYGNGVTRTLDSYYDVAATKFEPLVRDALRAVVDSIVRRRKGKSIEGGNS